MEMYTMRRPYSKARAGVLRSIPGAAALLFTCLTGTTRAADAQGPIDGTRIANAERDPGNWLTYGRTYSEQRYSPLKQISAENANRLGLAWFADLDTNRGQEATPLVI